MFLRLQNGTTLKAQEKRNAYPGNMRDYIKELASHNFFVKSVNFQNSRFSHEHVAAQLCLMTINGDLCDIKDRNLNEMYLKNQNFDKNGIVAKKINRVLNYLYTMFPDKAPELKRFNTVSLYALIMDLIDSYAIKDREVLCPTCNASAKPCPRKNRTESRDRVQHRLSGIHPEPGTGASQTGSHKTPYQCKPLTKKRV